MPEGVIQGGWPYVIAAYSMTALVLTAYAASLFLRMRKARSEGERASERA